MSSSPSQVPFWKDEPEPPPAPPLPAGLLRLVTLTSLIAGTCLAGGLLLLLLYQWSPALAWVGSALLALLLGLSLLRSRRRRLAGSDVLRIQERARQQTGAFLIGSAIHVAGHPMLDREQPVVLALTLDGLRIFRYDSPAPVDSIPLQQLMAIHTVVYDDERTPHLDAVDSAAQALQLTLRSRGAESTCLFRRMRRARPIDWYHALQKARWQANQA